MEAQVLLSDERQVRFLTERSSDYEQRLAGIVSHASHTEEEPLKVLLTSHRNQLQPETVFKKIKTQCIGISLPRHQHDKWNSLYSAQWTATLSNEKQAPK